MRATSHQLRTQARGSSAHVEAKMNQIGSPSGAQGKHVEDWLQISIGKSRSEVVDINSKNEQHSDGKFRKSTDACSETPTCTGVWSASHVKCDLEGV